MIASRCERQQLFYGQWRWCGTFWLGDCHALRKLQHRHIDRVMYLRCMWGSRSVNRYGGSWRGGWNPTPITEKDIIALHRMCDFLLTDSTPRKTVFNEHTMQLYTNDQAWLHTVADLGLARLMHTREATIKGQPNTVMLKNSRYDYRSYLRKRQLDQRTRASVSGYLLAQQDVRLGPSLAQWCTAQHGYIHSHFFLDHHDPSALRMLELISPGLVRITLPIVADK